VRVERDLDGCMQGQDGGLQLGAQAAALEQAHPVLAGDRAAQRQRLGDDLLERLLGPQPGRLVAERGDQQRVQVPVARRRSAVPLDVRPTVCRPGQVASGKVVLCAHVCAEPYLPEVQLAPDVHRTPEVRLASGRAAVACTGRL
jgi:hypothetical protein